MPTAIKIDAPKTTAHGQTDAAPRFPKKGIRLDDHNMRADSGCLRIVEMRGSGYKSTSNIGRQVNKAIGYDVIDALDNLGAALNAPKLFRAEDYNASPMLKAIHQRLCAIEDEAGMVVGSWTLVVNMGEPRRIVGALIEEGNRTLVVGPTFDKVEEL